MAGSSDYFDLGAPTTDAPWLSVPAPDIELALANDAGRSATDRITNDATIDGAVGDDGRIVSVKAALDAFGKRDLKDISAHVAADGSFSLDHEALASLSKRGTLADGRHTLYLQVTDDEGNTSRARLSFVLDTKAPDAARLSLDTGSDTGYRGDGRTETALVDLAVRAGAGTVVTVGDHSATTDARGRARLEDVELQLGTHDYTVTVTDLAGNATTSTLTLTRLENSVVTWNTLALEAIKATSTAPMYATRLLAEESVAVLDIIDALEQGRTAGLSAGPRWLSVNQEAAIAQAAFDILIATYAGNSGPYSGTDALRATLADALAASLAEIPDGIAEQRGIALGHRAAKAVLAARADDGWNAVVDPAGEIGTDPGEWRPTPAAFADPLAPQWGHVDPWAIESADQFLPPAPPALDSAEYATAYNETKAIGAADSAIRTADQTHIALFWADGGGTHTPPGHWNQIAGEVAAAEGLTSAGIARLFAELNVALADAAITCWNAKYAYDTWRPVTAIRLGDTDGNAATAGDTTWSPLIATPPFPEYTSGHSTFSGAAAAILAAHFGDNYAFTTGTSSTNAAIAGTTRSFDSFWDAALEAGQSRIFGGIHFQPANVEGLRCGSLIAQWVLHHYRTRT